MNKTATVSITILGLTALTFAIGSIVKASPGPRTPVGYYDGQRVYGGSREAQAGLAAVETKTKDQLAAAQKASADYQSAAKAKGGPSEAADADPAVAPKLAAARAAGEAYKRASDDARAAVNQQIDKRIEDAVGRLASARGMTIVFPTAGKLPYAAPEADLTQDLVNAVDAAGPVK